MPDCVHALVRTKCGGLGNAVGCAFWIHCWRIHLHEKRHPADRAVLSCGLSRRASPLRGRVASPPGTKRCGVAGVARLSALRAFLHGTPIAHVWPVGRAAWTPANSRQKQAGQIVHTFHPPGAADCRGGTSCGVLSDLEKSGARSLS